MSTVVLSFPDRANLGLTWADIAHMKEAAELVAQLRRDRAVPLMAKGYLELIIEELIAMVDQLDGDCDLEIACEDEGAQCDDEGDDSDREPDRDDEIDRRIPGSQGA